eukprot:11978058-Ditylum_brightwellii.AAC.1
MFAKRAVEKVDEDTDPYFCQYEGDIDEDFEKFVKEISQDSGYVAMSGEVKSVFNHRSKVSTRVKYER